MKRSVAYRTVRLLTLILLLAMAATAPAQTSAACETVAPGECLQVTSTGSGPDVVLIPGLFGASFAFRKLVPLLVAEGYRASVIEPLGVGDSAKPPRADYSLAAQARRIASVIEGRKLGPAILVSHAIGTAMALRVAIDSPDLVRALVSVEGGPSEEVTTPGFRRAMKFMPILKLFGAGRVIRGRVRSTLESRSGDRSWVTDAVVDGYSAGPSRDLNATLDVFAQMARAREPELLAPRLQRIRCPVRLVLGLAPHEGRPADAELATLRNHLARFEVSEVPGAGNFVFEEAPAALASIVLDVAREATPLRIADSVIDRQPR